MVVQSERMHQVKYSSKHNELNLEMERIWQRASKRFTRKCECTSQNESASIRFILNIQMFIHVRVWNAHLTGMTINFISNENSKTKQQGKCEEKIQIQIKNIPKGIQIINFIRNIIFI